MSDDDFEVVQRGSGNVFRDFGYADADIRQRCQSAFWPPKS